MPDNSYLYYDHDACAFVEAAPHRQGRWLKAGAVLGLSLVLSAVGVGALAYRAASPADVAQAEEIHALQSQLASAHVRLTSFSDELEELAATDREIYRAVLNAEPISEDEFQTSAGVADGVQLARFSGPTAELLEETSEAFGRLEHQLEVQNRSYAEIRSLASDRDAVLRQQPAILPLKDARLTSGYGMRYHPVLRVSRMHAGVDFPTPVGTPLYATGDGRVSFVGTRGGYGTVVEVEHPLAGKMTRYAHLTRAAAGIRPGAQVRRGQTVAYSGNTGLSTAPHLHYEVRKLDASRTPTNPVATFVPDVTPAQYRELLAAARSPAISFD